LRRLPIAKTTQQVLHSEGDWTTMLHFLGQTSPPTTSLGLAAVVP